MASSSTPQSERCSLGMLTIPFNGDEMTVTTLIDLIGIVGDAVPDCLDVDCYWFDSEGVYFDSISRTMADTVIEAVRADPVLAGFADSITFEVDED